MVEGIKRVHIAQNDRQSDNIKISRASMIFNAADNGDGILEPAEALNFGFTTLGNQPLTRQQFIEKFNEFRERTATMDKMIEPFKDIFYTGVDKPFLHEVEITKEQQKELLSRLEMFDAYRKTLNKEETEELIINKSDTMCFNSFLKDRPVIEDYPFPDDVKKEEIKSMKNWSDPKYFQIKEFFNDGIEKLKNDLRAGKINRLQNGMLAKYINLASINDLESDGKIGGFRQGGIGDCWFLANLMNYASNPNGEKNIKDRIKKNKNGSYTVIFNNPFDQTKKEEYTVSKKELKNYGQYNFDNREDEFFSTGDIDVRILEIAANKLLSKYLNPKEADKKVINGGSYLKYALIHKALGFTDNIKVYNNFIDLPNKKRDITQLIREIEYEIIKDENGKAKLGNKTEKYTGYRSFLYLLNEKGYKPNELTCSSLSDKEYSRKKADDDYKFTQYGHAYNIRDINREGVVTNNPLYAGFPHVMRENLFTNDFFQEVAYFPQNNIITVDKLKSQNKFLHYFTKGF